MAILLYKHTKKYGSRVHEVHMKAINLKEYYKHTTI